jgi:2-dehydro-3-deoxy-L-rhamnonate dehydrogenase (NAD+)
MSKPLPGQAAIITGGARGIGRGIAQRLAAEGCRIALWDLSFQPFNGTTAGFTPVSMQTVDIADLKAVYRAYEATVADVGDIDILINNAGINGPVANSWEYPIEAWDRVLAVDLTGAFYCTRVVLPGMRERRYGRIVNIASMAGKEGVPGISGYAAAKGGLIAFTKSVARELTDCGVMINAVAPALTETELFEQMTPEHIATMKSKIPMGRCVQIEDIASLVAWMVSPGCSFTTGFTFDVSGGRAVY